MKLSQNLIWTALSGFGSVVNILPHRLSVLIGGWIGLVVWFFSRSRVDRAEARCVRALQVGVTTARRIVKESYRNLGRGLAEFLRLPDLGEKVLDFVEIHGEENLTEALERGKGVIFLTAHFGNWEYTASAMSVRGFPMNAIGAEQRDPRITELVVSLRSACGVKTMSKGFDLKSAVRCLREGQILGILLDQDFGENGIVVPFLGIPASTPFGPVKMAEKIGSAVVPTFIIRREDGVHHDLYILPALGEAGGLPFGKDVEASLGLCNDTLGEWIRRYPDQWMWLYPRWASTTGDI
ncbi:MAG: lysophospholipid acyltransferase family protein [Thermovirgaceae bacterium]|nr:lysophospholipid acyltransferase family protein [Thermovirgaceae bacterium]